MFDTKLRRQSIDRNDLFHGHIGGMDVMARSLLAAQRIFDIDELEQWRTARYARWNTADGNAIMNGDVTLADLHAQQMADESEPEPTSGRQEYLENLVARTVDRTI